MVTAESVKPMKRFFERATVEQAGDSWRVMLDSKAVKTPRGTFLELPSVALAEAVANEWHGQGETLKPKEMPLTTIGCTALDLVLPEPEKCIERMLPYLSTDTVCYEDENQFLAELQRKEWGPLRAWFEEKYTVNLSLARGLAVPSHAEGTLQAVESQLVKRDHWELCALEIATQTAKSFVVASALLDRHGATAEDGLRWALLEEHFQIERWGLVEGEHDVSHSECLFWLSACRRFVESMRSDAANANAQ